MGIVCIRSSCVGRNFITATATTVVRPCYSTENAKALFPALARSSAQALPHLPSPSKKKHKIHSRYQENEFERQHNTLFDLQNVRAEGHVVEPRDDLGEPRENEESSERQRSCVCRPVLEVRGVVRTCFQPMGPTQTHGGRYMGTIR